MRVWLLQGQHGEDPGGLQSSLREWASRPENGHWLVDVRLLGAGLASEVRTHQPEVLVAVDAAGPPARWAEEILPLGVGLVVATAPPRAEVYRALTDQYPVCLVPDAPGTDTLGLAVLNAQAALRRQLSWKSQVEQLQQRLNDRIVIERAKGILVQRLGITEEEAYKRLRLLSRRQRRQIRDIAQSLLDTQILLMPEGNGLLEPLPPRAGEEAKQSPPATRE